MLAFIGWFVIVLLSSGALCCALLCHLASQVCGGKSGALPFWIAIVIGFSLAYYLAPFTISWVG